MTAAATLESPATAPANSPAPGAAPPSPQPILPGQPGSHRFAPSVPNTVQRSDAPDPKADAAFDAAFEATATVTDDEKADVESGKLVEGLIKGEKPAATEALATKPATDKTATEATAEAKPAAPVIPDRETREKIVKAKIVLGRTGAYDGDELDAMPTDKLLAKAEKLAPQFEAVESLKKDVQKWKAKARGTQTGDPADGQDNSPGRSGQEVDESAQADGAEPLPPAFGQLIDELKTTDPDYSKRLSRAMGYERQQIMSAAKREVFNAQRTTVQTRLDLAVEQLSEQFPGLKDPGRVDDFRKAVAKLDDGAELALSGSWADFLNVSRNACWVVFGGELSRQAQRSLTAKAASAANSQPDVSARPPRGELKLTAEQVEDLKFELVARGYDEPRVKAELVKLGVRD